MKRFLALLLTFSFLLAPCGHRQVRAEAVVDLSFADDITGMNDPRLLPYLEDTIYASLVADLNSEEYFVENVQVVYISQEYLDEVAYNSQANIFFGYTLAELDAQFDGAKYVFTLGDDGSTVVEPFVEYYDDTYDRILRNVAVGTGVILICVTVSVVSAGVGAPAISMIFAASAKTGTIIALSGGGFGVLSSGMVAYIQTGDTSYAFKAAALGGSESFKWGAIVGSVSGGASKAYALKGATTGGLTMNEAARIQQESGWPLEAIKALHSSQEYAIYRSSGISPVRLSSGKWIFPQQIDWSLVDENGYTNIQRVLDHGWAPIDATGQSYELHHIGMMNDSPLAVLTYDQHHSAANYSILHYKEEGKTISPYEWSKQKRVAWKEILLMQTGVR